MEALKPYLREKPYIFISYAHKDKETVFPILEKMQEERCRFWFDEGIDPGSEWCESIAEKIVECDCFIAFFSQNYLNSENCQNEIYFATNHKKVIVPIFLEDVKPNIGLEMQLCRFQRIYYHKQPLDKFYQRLFRAPDVSKFQEPKTPNEPLNEPQIILHDITIRYPDGDVYRGEGLLEVGEIEPFGYGTYTHSNGDVYEGENEYGIPIFGKMTYANGDVYEGDWYGCDDGAVKWDGNGTLRYANGDEYSGAWREGKQCGTGILISINEEKAYLYVYRGNWLDGKMHGEGTIYRVAKGLDDAPLELFLEGKWENGEFIG